MPDQNHIPTIRMFAFAWNRFMAASLLLLISLIYAKMFTVAFLSEEIPGNWLFLGGPSLWWATNFLNTIAIIYLMLYCLFTTKWIEITQNDQLMIVEKYFWRKLKYEIPESSINSIQASTTKIGGKYLWILFFGIQMWYLVVDGIAWLSNPFAFGLGLTTGWVYLIQALVDITALFLIIGVPPIDIHYYTQEYKHSLLIPGLKPRSYKILSKLLQSGTSIKSDKFKIQINRLTKRKNYFIVGIITIAIAVIGKASKIFVSDPLSISLTIAGLIWLNYGWNYKLPPMIRYPKIYIVAGFPDRYTIHPPTDKPMVIWNILLLMDILFWVGFGLYSLLILN